VPAGRGSLTISLTSSNTSLSGGNVVDSGVSAVSAVDQVGNLDRITLLAGAANLPPRPFSFSVAKTGGFFAGDSVGISGGANDVITLQVTNLTNPGASGIFRGESGTFRIDSVVGRTVRFTIQNLRMVSQTSSSSFNLNGSGQFTVS
jgi:hypothetical protein